jgi:predicted lipoprotein with Yx(FWY)xxD motif
MKLRLWRVLGLALPLTTLAAEPATTAPPATTPAAATVAPSGPPVRERNGLLVDLKGRGLYIYTGDTVSGRSQCDAQCMLLWPPLAADPNAKARGQFTVATRSDGTLQWALRGQPLYRWRGDKKRGDAGGDGVAGVWKLVRVAPPVAPLLPKPVKP